MQARVNASILPSSLTRLADSGSFPVMAECRWVRQDSLENAFEAGYEITEITTLGARELRGLIDSIVEES